MGHDISGFNLAGKEIAYARFNMWNSNAIILYNLLDADKYYAGVSGNGGVTSFTRQQMEKALHRYRGRFGNDDSVLSSNDSSTWDQKQIFTFIQNCLSTAQKEGNVRVYFG